MLGFIVLFRLTLQVAVYTLNGTYLGLRPVGGGTIQLCPDTNERLNAAWSFGTAYSQSVSDTTQYYLLLSDENCLCLCLRM